MNRQDQLRRRRDGSIDIDFYTSLATHQRAAVRRAILSRLIRSAGSMKRNLSGRTVFDRLWCAWSLTPHRGR